MGQFKSILIPTDFSENANRAAELAIETFIDVDVQFHLVHTYYLLYSGAVITNDLENILKQERAELVGSQLEALRIKYPEANIHAESVQGRLVDMVSEAAKRHQADLMVIGTKGASGFEAAILGSNAVNIMKVAEIPVLLVPKDCKVNKLKKLVFASDLKKLNNNETITPLYNMVKCLNAEIHILNLSDNQEFDLERTQEEVRLKGLFMDLPHKFHFRTPTDHEDDILDFAHEHNADVIALIARSHGFIYRMLHRSLVRELSMHTDLPILILKEKEA